MMNRLTVKLDKKAVSSEGEFEGYASVFNNADRGDDMVMPGAFDATLATKVAEDIKLLWQHDPTEPIGVIEEMYEDEHGLFVKGRFLLDVARANEALTLIREGVLDGLSIGYKTLKSKLVDGVRQLLSLDLWEVSVVTFPMNEAAGITAFKTIRDFEGLLRDAGFSRKQAKAIAADGYKAVEEQRDGAEDCSQVVSSINNLISKMEN